MLECVDAKLLKQLKETSPGTTLKVPQQVAVTSQEALFPSLEASGMKFPLVAKPLVADGTLESHKMFLVLSSVGLSKLQASTCLPPKVVGKPLVGPFPRPTVGGTGPSCTPRRSLQGL